MHAFCTLLQTSVRLVLHSFVIKLGSGENPGTKERMNVGHSSFLGQDCSCWVATSRDVTHVSNSFADAVLDLDALIDEQSTELNMRNKHVWWQVVHDAVRKQLSNDERVILDEPLPRKRRGEPFSEDAIRQRDAKRKG